MKPQFSPFDVRDGKTFRSAGSVCLLLVAVVTAASGQGRLVWQDEFDGPAGSPPDSTKWTHDLGAGGWGNQERETYTKSTANVAQDGQGHLIIRATKNASGGYDSARIKTQGRFSFTYGRVEARMKLPRGQGMWPAFWMLGDDIKKIGWPKCGEIDVMENIGRESTVMHGTVHGPGYSASHGITAEFTFAEQELPSDGFHVYEVNWTHGKIEFVVDGKIYHTVTPQSLPPGTKWVFDRPFFLLLNLAVGGKWPGNPDDTTRFPQEFIVDWVRVDER